MSWGTHENRMTYKVVVNHEEQYSIWPDFKEIPAGWKAVGKTGDRETCLAFIKEAWADMRPFSLRSQRITDRMLGRHGGSRTFNKAGFFAYRVIGQPDSVAEAREYDSL